MIEFHNNVFWGYKSEQGYVKKYKQKVKQFEKK